MKEVESRNGRNVWSDCDMTRNAIQEGKSLKEGMISNVKMK